MNRTNKLPPRYQAGTRYYRVLEEISAGDLFVGFLSSAASTRLLYKTAHARAKARYENKQVLMRLEQCGYIKKKSRNGIESFVATKQGALSLQNIAMHTHKILLHPERWDGTWRVISYDFPEKERSKRNSLRYMLEKVGFLQIQKSMWVFPYETPQLTELLSRDTIMNSYTLSMHITHISNDFAYRKHFGVAGKQK